MTTFSVNGVEHTVDVDTKTPLLWVLRETLGLTGTKYACGIAQCGACTVHLDGNPIRSCIFPVGQVGGSRITTIEGLRSRSAKAIQSAWEKLDVVQCGFCQSGQIMSASALLARVSNPTDNDIDDAMAGNICRCVTYFRIRAAIKEAAKALA